MTIGKTVHYQVLVLFVACAMPLFNCSEDNAMSLLDNVDLLHDVGPARQPQHSLVDFREDRKLRTKGGNLLWNLLESDIETSEFVPAARYRHPFRSRGGTDDVSEAGDLKVTDLALTKAIQDGGHPTENCVVPLDHSQELKQLLNMDWLRFGLVVLAALQLILQLYFLPAYLKDRQDMYITSRSPILTVIHSVCGIVMSILACVGFVAALQNFRIVMMVQIWMQSFLVPFLAVPTGLRALRLLSMWRLNSAKKAASELMPLIPDKNQVGFASMFQIEAKMIQSHDDSSEARHVQLACWGATILLLYSIMWYCLSLGRCTVSLVQVYNAIAMNVLSMLWLAFCLFRIRHITDAFRIRNELYAVFWAHLLFSSLQLAAFIVISHSNIMPAVATRVGYLSYAIVGTVWPVFAVYSQLVFPLQLRKRVERYRSKVAKNEMAFRSRFDDPVQREIFFKYLDLEFSAELYLFWRDVEVFRSLPAASTREAGRIIYTKYARDGAMLDVKLDKDLQLESSWNMQSASIGPDMFDVAQNAIYVKMLSAFPRYLHFVALNPTVLPKVSDAPAIAVQDKQTIYSQQSTDSIASDADNMSLILHAGTNK